MGDKWVDVYDVDFGFDIQALERLMLYELLPVRRTLSNAFVTIYENEFSVISACARYIQNSTYVHFRKQKESRDTRTKTKTKRLSKHHFRHFVML